MKLGFVENMRRAFDLVCVVTLLLCGLANASTIAYWDFNDQSTAPSQGSGSISTCGGVTIGSYISDEGNYDPASTGYAISTSNYPQLYEGNKTAGLEFHVSTEGYIDIAVSWDTKHDASASKWTRLQYTVDGVNWIDCGTSYEGIGTGWNVGQTADLKAAEGVANNPDFAFRLVTEFAAYYNRYVATIGSSYSPTASIYYDLVSVTGVLGGDPPSVTVNQASAQEDPADWQPINYKVVFSQPVQDFSDEDVAIGGTAGGNQTAVVTEIANDEGDYDKTTYNVAVSGVNSSGTVVVSMPAGVAHNGAGYPNTASTSTDNSVTFNYDSDRPTVTVGQSANQDDPCIKYPLNFTVTFNKTVVGFSSGEVTLGGTAGATTAVVTGSGRVYNVEVSGMTQTGTVTLSVPAGIATDYLGNTNAASTSSDNSIQFDKVPSVKVLTYNTARHISGTATGDEDISKQMSMARIIQNYQPDIICLNEIGAAYASTKVPAWINTYIPYLGGECGTTYFMHIGGNDGYICSVIISRYPMYDTGTFYVDPRSEPCATIDLPGPTDIRVHAVHLKCCTDGWYRRYLGANRVASVLRYTDSNGCYENLLKVVCGDLNEDEDGPYHVAPDPYPPADYYHPITTIRSEGLQDPAPLNGYDATSNKTYQGSSGCPVSRLDYVMPSDSMTPLWGRALYTENLDPMLLYPCTEIYATDSKASDHISVIGDFAIPEFEYDDPRQMDAGAEVIRSGMIVTASYSDHFYVEAEDRSIAFRVNSTARPTVGTLVNVKGTVMGIGGERAINASVVRAFNTMGRTIQPYCMSCRSVGGSDFDSQTPGVENGYGPYNMGFLVKTYGRVTTSPDSGSFTIDDGSGFAVKVNSSKSVQVGDFVVVTGVVGYEVPDGCSRSLRLIKTRTEDDVQCVD